MTSQHCSVCFSNNVAYFCTCTVPESCLCGLCSLKHILKITRDGHALRPISLLQQYQNPLFLTRCAALPFVYQQTSNWVDDLETVITEFTQQVQTITAALTALSREKTAQLRQLKAELAAGVAEAFEEVERTLGEEKPQLRSRYGAEIRAMVEEYNGEGVETLQQTQATDCRTGSLAGTVPDSIAVLRLQCSLLPYLSIVSCSLLPFPVQFHSHLQAMHLSLSSLLPIITQQLQLDARRIDHFLGCNQQIQPFMHESCSDSCDLDFISDLEAAVGNLLRDIRAVGRGEDVTVAKSCVCFEQLSLQMEKTVGQAIQLLELLGLPSTAFLGLSQELTGRERLLRQQHSIHKGLKAACKHLKGSLHSCFQQALAVSHSTAGFLSSSTFLQETVEGIKRDNEIEGDRLDQVTAVLELLAGLQPEWQSESHSLVQLRTFLGVSTNHRSDKEDLQSCVAHLQAKLESALRTLLAHSRYLDAFVPAGEAKQRSISALCELETALNYPNWPLFSTVLQHLTTQQTLINPFLATGDYLGTTAAAEAKPHIKKWCAVPSAVDRIDTSLEYILRDVGTLEKLLEIPTDLTAQLKGIDLAKGLERVLLRQKLIHSRLLLISTNLSASSSIAKGMDLLFLLAKQVSCILYKQSAATEETVAIEKAWGQEKLMRQQAALFKTMQSIWQAVETGKVGSQDEDLEELVQRSVEVVGAFQLTVERECQEKTDSPGTRSALQRRTILRSLSSLETHAWQIRTEHAAVSSLLSRLKETLEASLGTEFTTDWSAVSDSPCDQLPLIIDYIGKYHSQHQSLLRLSGCNEASEKLGSGIRVKTWSEERNIWVLFDIPQAHIVEKDRQESLMRRPSLNTELTHMIKDLCKPSVTRNPYANSRKCRSNS